MKSIQKFLSKLIPMRHHNVIGFTIAVSDSVEIDGMEWSLVGAVSAAFKSQRCIEASIQHRWRCIVPRGNRKRNTKCLEPLSRAETGRLSELARIDFHLCSFVLGDSDYEHVSTIPVDALFRPRCITFRLYTIVFLEQLVCPRGCLPLRPPSLYSAFPGVLHATWNPIF